VPWPKGALRKADVLMLANEAGQEVPVQSWALAHWPDGSVKWSGHCMPPHAPLSTNYVLKEGKPLKPAQSIQVQQARDKITINTGLFTCEVATKGEVLVSQILRNGRPVAQNGRLVMHCQNSPEAGPEAPLQTTLFAGAIHSVKVEQNGPVRAVVKISGAHRAASGRTLLPFVVRLYFYAGSEAIRLMHSIVYDANENQDFISGLGIRFDVPLNGPAYNRHVRFTGVGRGVFAEAVQGLTGLRRDAGAAVRKAQVSGTQVSPDNIAANVRAGLQYIPAFGDYSLSQPTADGYSIRKRTGSAYGWVPCTAGQRALGTAYLGTPQGGFAAGIRHFWQSNPTQIDIRNAHTQQGEMTLWLWSPDAPPMDMRFYHDGLGQDTYQKQLAGLDITYEDYEPGFGTPHGVARTSELQLWVLDATPSNEQLAAIAAAIEQPPQLLPAPYALQQAGAFGGFWTTPQGKSEAESALDEQLDFYFGFYQKQVEQHRWYGYWNYGDVMHSYDPDRHTWKYDIGGFAWDNSELSTDLWLWFYFLRTGRADVFRMAEAMTRHTGEVDVHHIGRFAPLGSRHNVQHWGCSAKQLRISTVANRRIFYYLTADERVGDLMDEQVEAYRTLQQIAPGRKLPKGDVQQTTQSTAEVNMAFGTDWGSVAAAWLTHWERTGDKLTLKKLQNSMTSIAAQPHGFFTGGAPMDLATGAFLKDETGRISVSHLNAAFGLPEVCAELIQTFDMPEFEKAWLQYCRLYNAPAAEQVQELGKELGRLNLGQGHSRLTAYAAMRLNDEKLKARAWQEFYRGDAGIRRLSRQTITIQGPSVMQAVEEAPGISTNAVVQWGLAAMQCMACAGLPPAIPAR